MTVGDAIAVAAIVGVLGVGIFVALVVFYRRVGAEVDPRRARRYMAVVGCVTLVCGLALLPFGLPGGPKARVVGSSELLALLKSESVEAAYVSVAVVYLHTTSGGWDVEKVPQAQIPAVARELFVSGVSVADSAKGVPASVVMSAP